MLTPAHDPDDKKGSTERSAFTKAGTLSRREKRRMISVGGGGVREIWGFGTMCGMEPGTSVSRRRWDTLERTQHGDCTKKLSILRVMEAERRPFSGDVLKTA